MKLKAFTPLDKKSRFRSYFLGKRYLTGFTIAEILVAITVFTIGILAVVQVFPLHRRLARISEKATVANYLAQEQFEKLFSLPYSEVTPGTYEIRAPLAAAGDFSQYERETLVELVDANYQPSGTDLGLKKAMINVYFTENSQTRTESLVSIVSDR